MEVFYIIFQQTFMVAIPLVLVALGGMFSERSGTVNIALEGIMVIGAFLGVLVIKLIQDASEINPQLLLLIGLICAGAGGIVFALLLAFSAVTMKSDQTVGGSALNIIAPALVIFVARMLYETRNIDFVASFFLQTTFLSNIPLIGPMFFTKTYPTIYYGIILIIICTFVLYKTKFGLRLRACGEHPQAADSVGINVNRIRYAGVIISGFLGGVGGLMYITAISTGFGGTVNGYGFLALGVMIFGQWKPIRIFFSGLFFAFIVQLGSFYANIPFLYNLNIPVTYYNIFPYVATLIVLIFTSKKSRGPKAAGVPFDKGKR